MFIICVMSSFTIAIAAQNTVALQVMPANQTSAPNQTIVLNITVANFVNIGGCQFSLRWDPTKLQYQSLTPILSGLTMANFGTASTPNGILTTSFIPDPAATLPNGSSLFSLRFLVVGKTGPTEIIFDNTPTPIEVSNASGTVLPVQTAKGIVGIFDPGPFTQSPLVPLYETGALYFKIRDTSSANATYVPGNPNASTPQLYPIFQKYGVTRMTRPFEVIDKPPFLRIYRVHFTQANSVEAFIKDLAALPFIQFAEKVPYKETFAPPPPLVPNDPSVTGGVGMDAYQLGLMRAYDAFGLPLGAGGTVVAIVDDAVLTTHEDLATSMYFFGQDVADLDANPDPPFSGTNAAGTHKFSHGTHVAGIAGGATNNGLGIASIGWGNKIMGVKCVGDGATFTTNMALGYDGVAWASVNGAQVINMSWGGGAPSQAEYLVIKNAYDSGIILVAAAGNYFQSNAFYPAAYGEGKTGQSWELLNRNLVIAVAALDRNSNHSIWGSTFFGISGSNFGNWVDIAAYGTGIYSSVAGSSSGSAVNNLYTDYDGTSMAAPQVAGLAGLMRSYKPLATRDEIIACIINNANPDIYDPVSHPDNIPGTLGSGRVDAYNAMRCLGVLCPGPDAPLAYVTPNLPTLCPGSPTVIQANDGTGYLWSTSATTQSISVSSTGTYTVTVTFSGGCTASTTVNVVPASTAAGIKIIDGSGNVANDGILCGQDFLFLAAYSGNTYQWNVFGATTPSIGPINTGVYTPQTHNFTVTVTDAGGCLGLTSTASVAVTWLDPPTAKISVQENSQLLNDGIVCNGTAVGLTASGGINYLWSNTMSTPAITVSPSVTSIYTVTVKDASGCTNEASTQVKVLPVCIDTCCRNAIEFNQNVAAGFTRTGWGCTVTLRPNQLNDCQKITYHWGDGSSSGPVSGNAAISHTYTGSNDYSVCVEVREYNATGQACFQKDTCLKVCVKCDCPAKTLDLEWGGQETPAYLLNLYREDLALDGSETALFSASGSTSTNYNGLTISNYGKLDGVIAKTDPASGTVLKALAIGGTEDDNAGAIAVSGTAVYVGGIFYSPVCRVPSGSSAPDVLLNNHNAGTADFFLAKYNTNLELIWAFVIGNTGNDALTDVSIDPDDNVLATGYFQNTVDFAPNFVTADRSSTSYYDLFLAKYSPTGSFIWANTYGAAQPQMSVVGWGISQDAAGNPLIAGEVYGGSTGGSAQLGTSTVMTVATGASTGFLMKAEGIYGSADWVQEVQPSQGAAFSVKDNSGQIIVGGGKYIASYTGSGTQNWVYPTDFFVYDLATDQNQRIYLTGYSDKVSIRLDFKNAAQPKTNKGRTDIVAAVYDQNGNYIKGHNPGGSDYDEGYGIVAAKDGSAFYTQGLTWSSDFDPDPTGTTVLPALNGHSYSIAKFTCDCPGNQPFLCDACGDVDAKIIHKPSDTNCCAAVRIQNTAVNVFYGVNIQMISGGKLPVLDVSPQTGWQIGGFVDGTSVLVRPTSGGSLPVGDHPCAFICLKDLTASEQVIEIQYLSATDSIICRDTFRFECAYCIEVIQDTVACKGIDKREWTFCVHVPAAQPWNVNAIIFASPIPGITFDPPAISLPNVAPGTNSCAYTTTVVAAVGTVLPDTLCINMTAHQRDVTKGFPPGLCCTTTACVAIPDCLCDSTWAEAASATLMGDTCCWKITLHNPNGVFQTINTNILTPGVAFSTLTNPGSSGWSLDFNTVKDVSWAAQLPQGPFIQNNYTLPTICFGDDGTGFNSPFEVQLTWFTADSARCDTTITLACQWISENTGDGCILVDSLQSGCTGGSFQTTVRVINNTTAPPFSAEKVVFTPIFPPGLVITPSMTSLSLPVGGYVDIPLTISGSVTAGMRYCFIAQLYDVDQAGRERNCCSSDTLCYWLPVCPNLELDNSVWAFPNPANALLHVYFAKETLERGVMRLLDVNGRAVLTEDAPSGSVSRDVWLTNLPSGVYFLEVAIPQQHIWRSKVVKQ